MVYAAMGIGALIGSLAATVRFLRQRSGGAERAGARTSIVGLLILSAINLAAALISATGPASANLDVPLFLAAIAAAFVVVMVAFLLWVLVRAVIPSRRSDPPLAPPDMTGPH
jgi:hypothetical protein